MKKMILVLAIIFAFVSIIEAKDYTVYTDGNYENGDLPGNFFRILFSFSSDEEVDDIHSIPVVLYDGSCQHGECYWTAWFVHVPWWSNYRPDEWFVHFEWGHPPEGERFEPTGNWIYPVYAWPNFLPFNRMKDYEEGFASGWCSAFRIY